jgi:hypothetical protein
VNISSQILALLIKNMNVSHARKEAEGLSSGEQGRNPIHKWSGLVGDEAARFWGHLP